MQRYDNMAIKKFQTRLPYELNQAVSHRALDEGISKNQAIIEALQMWVSKPATAPRTKRGQPPAQA